MTSLHKFLLEVYDRQEKTIHNVENDVYSNSNELVVGDDVILFDEAGKIRPTTASSKFCSTLSAEAMGNVVFKTKQDM